MTASYPFVSYLSGIADSLCRELAAYLRQQTMHDLTWIGASWPTRLKIITSQQAALGWICGLLHVHQARQREWLYRPIAAPVMLASRYRQSPIYFADMVVSRNAPFQSLADLAGSRWAYNEKGSLSGYQMLRQRGQTIHLFAQQIGSGSHLRSIDMVLSGEADCATVDSTVLDMLRQVQPDRVAALRVVAQIGPYTAPPLVMASWCETAVVADIAAALHSMHCNEWGQQLLQQWAVRRFVPIRDADYDDIRQIKTPDL